jgi:hypothetical protein
MANTTATLLYTPANPASRRRDSIRSYERTRKTINRATTGQPAHPWRENSCGCSNSNRYLGLNEIVETHTCTSLSENLVSLDPVLRGLGTQMLRYHRIVLTPLSRFYVPA